MNRNRIFLLTCMLLYKFSATAQLFKIPVDEKLSNASVIVEATVISQQSFWNSSHSMIYTASNLQIHKLFKGTLTGSSFHIVTQGGSVDNYSIEVSELLQLRKGETGMFFCIPNANGIKESSNKEILMDVYSSSQGFLKYDVEMKKAVAPFVKYDIQNLYKYLQEKTGKAPIEINRLPNFQQESPNSPAAPGISSFNPGRVYGGAYNDPNNNVLTINGSGFGNNPSNRAAVRFKNADNDDTNPDYLIRFDDPEIISWSDNRIEVRVPSKAATGFFSVMTNDGQSTRSAAALNVYYSLLTADFSGNVLEPRMMDTDGSGGYTLQYSNSTLGSGINITGSPIKATFERAVRTWQEIVGVKYKFGNPVSTQAVDPNDDINLIVMDNSNTGVPRLAQGVLAVTYSYFAKCVGQNFQAQKAGFDILIRNENFSSGNIDFTSDACFPARGEYDLETVLLHELGHSINLAHVYDDAAFSTANDYNTLNPSTLMHYSIIDFSNRRTPDGAAVQGALYAIKPQNNTYGNCGLAPREMQPAAPLTAEFDGCPLIFPLTPSPAGTSVFIDLAHSTSNDSEDPSFRQINCNNSGVYITNNAYYPIRTDASPNQSIKLCITGYTTDPSEQASCSQQGVRLSVYDINRCPGGFLFPEPIFCTTFDSDGKLDDIAGLEPNHNYLLYFDGLRNTKSIFSLIVNGPPGCAGSTEKEIFTGPNPMTNLLNIRFENAAGSRYNYIIYNATGQPAIQGEANITLPVQNITVSTGFLAAGIYFLQLIDQNGEIVNKPLLKGTR